jgi:hypothetical protein
MKDLLSSPDLKTDPIESRHQRGLEESVSGLRKLSLRAIRKLCVAPRLRLVLSLSSRCFGIHLEPNRGEEKELSIKQLEQFEKRGDSVDARERK